MEIKGIGKIGGQELTFDTYIPLPTGIDAERAEIEFPKKGLIKIHFPLQEDIHRKKKVPGEFTPVRPGKDDITI